MNRAVLDAYGWSSSELPVPSCELLLDYEEHAEDDGDGPARKRKKPWRYRWADDFRDEVPARLLELNKRRAEQESRAGAAEEGQTKKAKRTIWKKAIQGRIDLLS
jgi:hypothetical protein